MNSSSITPPPLLFTMTTPASRLRAPTSLRENKPANENVPPLQRDKAPVKPLPLATRPPSARVPLSARGAASAPSTARSVRSAVRPVPGSKPKPKPKPKPTSATKAPASAAPGQKKRPKWDVKGRLEDLEAATARLKEQYKNEKCTASDLQDQLSVSSDQVMSLRKENETLKEDVCDRDRTVRDLQRENEATTSRYRREIAELKEEGERDIRTLKRKLEDVTEESERRRQKVCNLEEIVHNHEEKISELEKQVHEDEITRRKLHNAIQELKGNIRVYCRIRPVLSSEKEKAGSEQESVTYHYPGGGRDPKTLEITAPPEASTTGGKEQSKQWDFSFDRVFQPGSTQEEVFDEISQLVQSALDGYRVCIFAYGQTGSGKTFTMEGPGMEKGYEQDQDRGMIPRAVEQIFQRGAELDSHGWKYSVQATYLEIYNEQIRDLLTNKDGSHKHEIKRLGGAKGSLVVTDLTTVTVSRAEQIYALLKRAGKNRSVGTTAMNERSSRSHSVFSLILKGTNEKLDQHVTGILNLIDLAGSERLSQSGSTGDRLKETQSINKSLSCLGDVIFALGNRESYVPYRNSKLTYLLQDSLGGDSSKTLMFVNINPSSEALNESICSLRFASKVNSCEIGTARRNAK